MHWLRSESSEETRTMLQSKRRSTMPRYVAVASPASPLTPAQAKEVKVALIAPFSGPWARQGDLMLKGAEMAIDDINAQGGIKALGGAKLKLVVIDAGDNIEKAKNAAQRMVAQESRSGRLHRRMAELLHAGSHRGHRARGSAVPDLVVLRPDHRARLPVHLPDLAHRRRSRRSRRCRPSSTSPRPPPGASPRTWPS